MIYPGPDYDRVLKEQHLDRRLAPDDDPEKPPQNAPKDWWLRIGLLAGATAGAVAGAIIGNGYYYISAGSELLVGLVIGLIVGGILGTICGLIGASIYRAVLKGHSLRKHSRQ